MLDQEMIELITKQVNEELNLEGFTNPGEKALIWSGVLSLINTLDRENAPIHNSLFIAALKSLTRSLELINSLRGTNGSSKPA